MRNIIQYPITIEEAAKVIERIQASFDPDLVGDERAMVLDWVLERAWRYEDLCV